MNDQFSEWIGKSKKEIDNVKLILFNQLSDEPEELIRDLQVVERWNGRMGFLLAEANAWLDRFRAFNMPDKKDKTEFERKVLLEESVANVKEYRDIIESVVDAIKQRLILGESILSYMKQFTEKSPAREKPW